MHTSLLPVSRNSDSLQSDEYYELSQQLYLSDPSRVGFLYAERERAFCFDVLDKMEKAQNGSYEKLKEELEKARHQFARFWYEQETRGQEF